MFIELNQSPHGDAVLVSVEFISGLVESGSCCIVHMNSGDKYVVKQTYKQVLELLLKTLKS